MLELRADLIMEKVPNVQLAAVAMALFAGVISAFVDNVATVLMVAPVALEICKKLKTLKLDVKVNLNVSLVFKYLNILGKYRQPYGQWYLGFLGSISTLDFR